MRVLVIDNYDSFTWNLVHYLAEEGCEVSVHRNDAISAGEAIEGGDAVVLSPGPGKPDGAGISLDVIAGCAATGHPLLGVCLGHQAIGQFFGGRVVTAPTLMHGKASPVLHEGSGVFADLPSPFTATRYHSLCLASDSMPESLEVTARVEDGTVMGVSHRVLPIHGVQFHPESVASEHGHRLLANFLALARAAA